MLFQRDIKLNGIFRECRLLFESSVISEGYQTGDVLRGFVDEFESSVISEGYQTQPADVRVRNRFESSVISEGYQTPP